MDMHHARRVVDRANDYRRMFDARRFSGAWREWRPMLAVGLLAFVMILIFTGATFVPVGANWFLAAIITVYVLPFVSMLVMLSWMRSVRAKRQAECVARIECPRCGAALRDDGPASWTGCAPEEIGCLRCGTAVMEEPYAAATLLSPWYELCRYSWFNPRMIVRFALLLGLAIAPMMWLLYDTMAVGIDTPRDKIEALKGRADWLSRISPILGFGVVGALLVIALLRRRLLRANLRRWTERPTCLRCAAPLPDIETDTPLAICASCGERHSIAQMRVDAVDGPRRSLVAPLRVE